MALNLDCVVDRDRISPVYANLIGITVMPVILMIISVFIWTMIKIFRSKMLWTKYVHYTEGTIINILFLVHPAILKTTMQLYACTNIEGTFYLDIFMDDKCWSGDHKQYAVTVAFPGLILWGLGLPFMAFYKLKKLNNQRLLKIKEKKEVYGFLYLGYSRQKYWWELVILSRKVIILIALIWLNRISVVIQALVALSMLMFAIYLQHSNKPYNGQIINNIEILSLIVGMVTVYAGLWYLTGDLGEETEIFLFVIMLTVNLFFAIVWITTYLGSAVWAASFVKYVKIEKKYINCSPY